MRKLFVAILSVSLTASFANAQSSARLKPAAPAVAAPAPDAGANPSVFQKLFGSRPTPTPAPATPTPAPLVKRRPGVKPKRAVVEKPEPEEKPAATAAVSKPATSKKKSAAAPKTDLSGLDDATKFKLVRARAVEDPQLKELKAKADSELDESEAQKAGAAYNRALFRKIREIEPSLDGYVDKVEGAMSKRLAAEKGKG